MSTNFQDPVVYMKSQSEPINQTGDSRTVEQMILMGPFQYGPLKQVEHPVQPQDDLSMRDPTLKTVERSRTPPSPYNVHASSKSMEQKQLILREPETPPLIAFTQQSQDFKSWKIVNKKQVHKYISKWLGMVKQQHQPFQWLFDLHFQDIQNQCNKYHILDIISLDNHYLNGFHILHFISLCFILIYYPIMITFESVNVTLVSLIIIVVISDIVLSMITQFAQDGTIITDGTAILANYYKSKALLDIVVLICNFVIMFATSSLIKWIAFIVMVIRSYIQFNRYISDFQLYQLIRLILSYLISIHLLTCLWTDVMFLEDQDTSSKILTDDSNADYYLQSLFWVVSIMSSNTNIIPTTKSQICLSMFVSICSIISLVYLFSRLSYLFRLKQEEVNLSQFINDNKINTLLRTKIKSYFDAEQQHKHYEYISKLSQPLKQEFNTWQRLSLLSKHFKGYSSRTLQKIANICEDIEYSAQQHITKEMVLDDCSIFFILDGNASLMTRNHQVLQEFMVLYQIIKKGDIFGEICFYTSQPRRADIITNGTCRVLKLSRIDFLSCLSNFDKQLFYQRRDDILFNQTYLKKCICCDSYNHMILQCPKLTYIPQKEFTIKSFLYPYKQVRQTCKYVFQTDLRGRKNKLNSGILYDIQLRHIADELVQLYCDNQFPQIQSESQLPYEDIEIRDSYTSASKSQGKTYSYPRQQSQFDQYSQPNYDFLPIEDHEFSAIAQGNDAENDEFVSLVRNGQQKNTYATAGFGHESVGVKTAKETTNKSLNIIEENESAEADSNEQDNVESTPQKQSIQLPVPTGVLRSQDPKLTFNNNFDQQMLPSPMHTIESYHNSNSLRQGSNRQNSLKPDSIRQGSSRSLTYTPINSSLRTAQNVSQTIKARLSASSFVSSKSVVVPSPISQNGNNNDFLSKNIFTQNNLNEFYEGRSVSKRFTDRKKSTKTGTRVSIAPSMFQPFSGNDNPIQGFGKVIENFEAMYNFELYLPHNNYTIVIQQANKKLYMVNNIKSLSHYFFNYYRGLQMWKLKHRLQATRQIDSPRGTQQLMES